jgi:hypothetical protein
MKPQELKSLDGQITESSADLLAPLGRSERRRRPKVYPEGFLLDGERKSIEPVANRISGADVQAF